MKTTVTALLATASLITLTAPATAHADCGAPGQEPCAGPVPTIDQVVADMAELTDPNIPAISKGNIVSPGFSPEEAGTVDDHLNRTNAAGFLPYTFVVTDIVPAPANFAGATVTVDGSFHQASAPQHIVLSEQGGQWLITHDSALTMLDHFWYNATRRKPFVRGNVL